MAECCKSLKSSITSKWPDNTEPLTLKKNGPVERAACEAPLLPAPCGRLSAADGHGDWHRNNSCQNGRARVMPSAQWSWRGAGALHLIELGEGRNLQNFFTIWNPSLIKKMISVIRTLMLGCNTLNILSKKIEKLLKSKHDCNFIRTNFINTGLFSSSNFTHTTMFAFSPSSPHIQKCRHTQHIIQFAALTPLYSTMYKCGC